MAQAADLSWTPGPPDPALPAGAVHVWRADLEAVDDRIVDSLSADERERGERFIRARDRLRWTRSRGVLRALLARYLQASPEALRFVVGANGKPALAPLDEPRKPSWLAFNLSHSGPVALYALAATGAVGIDVELADRERDAVALAARMFGAEEGERLARLDDEAREREFLRLWVRHEAELKCVGVGLTGGGGGVLAERRPWVSELEMRPGMAAALAVESEPRVLRFWDWPDG
jgi:4'-phosphopantetheinyl transferase